MTFWERTKDLIGPKNARMYSRLWKSDSLKNRSWLCQTIRNLFKLKAMHQNMLQEWSSHNWTQMATDTRWHFILNHSHLQNRIMTFMTENCWQLSKLWKPGDISRIWAYDNHSFWSSEFDLSQRSQKVEQTTSPMVLVLIWIRHQTSSYSRKEDDSIRCSISMTRPLSRRRQQ